MLARLVGAVMAASVSLVVPAFAQSALDGPLAAPDAAPAAPLHHPKAKARKAHHASAKPAPEATDAAHAVPADAPAPSHEAPADPLSLGMKWNGNNDSAAQTRSQNLDGNAAGTGAEVGMKLHF